MYVTWFISIVFLLAVAWPAEAKFEVKTEPAIKDGEDFITANNWCHFPTDAFIARTSDDGKLLGSIEYCAAYGHSSVQAFTDKSGRFYALIRRGTEHGTHATFYDLDIYRVVPGERFPEKIAAIPVEEPAGECHEVIYDFTPSDSPSGGLELHLRRTFHKDDPGCEDVPEGVPIPPDKELIIRLDIPN